VSQTAESAIVVIDPLNQPLFRRRGIYSCPALPAELPAREHERARGMGISGLISAMIAVAKPDNLYDKFAGNKVAIDGYVWLHAFAAVHARTFVSSGDTGPIVAAFMKRVKLLMEHGVHPVVILDGPPPPSKRATSEQRRARAEKARRAVREAVDAGTALELPDKFFEQAVRLHLVLIKDLVVELRKAGVSYVVSPYEADDTAAGNANDGLVAAVVSVDSDFVVKLNDKPLVSKVDYATGACMLFYRDRLFDAPEAVRRSPEGKLLDKLFGKTVDDLIVYAGFAGSDYMKVAGVGEGFARTVIGKRLTIDGMVKEAHMKHVARRRPAGDAGAEERNLSVNEISHMLQVHTAAMKHGIYYNVRLGVELTLTGQTSVSPELAAVVGEIRDRHAAQESSLFLAQARAGGCHLPGADGFQPVDLASTCPLTGVTLPGQRLDARSPVTVDLLPTNVQSVFMIAPSTPEHLAEAFRKEDLLNVALCVGMKDTSDKSTEELASMIHNWFVTMINARPPGVHSDPTWGGQLRDPWGRSAVRILIERKVIAPSADPNNDPTQSPPLNAVWHRGLSRLARVLPRCDMSAIARWGEGQSPDPEILARHGKYVARPLQRGLSKVVARSHIDGLAYCQSEDGKMGWLKGRMPASQRNADYEVIIRFKLMDVPGVFLDHIGDSERPPPPVDAAVCDECEADGARHLDGSSKLVAEILGGCCPCFYGDSPCSHECALAAVAVLICLNRDRLKHADWADLSCTALRCAWLHRPVNTEDRDVPVSMSNTMPVRYQSLRRAVVMTGSGAAHHTRVTAYDKSSGGPCEHFDPAPWLERWVPYGRGVNARKELYAQASAAIQRRADSERRHARSKQIRKVTAPPGAPAAAPPAQDGREDEQRPLCAHENLYGPRMFGCPMTDLPLNVARAVRETWPYWVVHRWRREFGAAPAAAPAVAPAAAPAAAPVAAPAAAETARRCAVCLKVIGQRSPGRRAVLPEAVCGSHSGSPSAGSETEGERDEPELPDD